MDDYFWINPLKLENAVDGGSRHSRCLERSESEESALKEDSVNSFIRSAQVAYNQIENLKTHMVDIQYSHLEPDSLSSHRYGFLNFSEEIIENKDTSLSDIFQLLQKYAVALYQVLMETEEVEIESEYYLMLQDSKDKMVQLLSNVMLAIDVFDMVPLENVTYEELPSHMKVENRISNKSIRDYLVFRDYSNFLWFVIEQKNNFLSLVS